MEPMYKEMAYICKCVFVCLHINRTTDRYIIRNTYVHKHHKKINMTESCIFI